MTMLSCAMAIPSITSPEARIIVRRSPPKAFWQRAFLIPSPWPGGFSNLEGLIAAVAIARVAAAQELSGNEIRFLRKALGWSSRELAAKLEVRDETVSRWENEKEPIGATSEKLLRLIVAQFLGDKAPALDVDQKRIVSMRIREVPRGLKAMEMRFRPI